MNYSYENSIEDSNVIYIDGTQEELIPGLNDIMARIAELYIDNYMDPDYLDELDDNEIIVIDYTALSEEEMHELVMCAITSLALEGGNKKSEVLLC